VRLRDGRGGGHTVEVFIGGGGSTGGFQEQNGASKGEKRRGWGFGRTRAIPAVVRKGKIGKNAIWDRKAKKKSNSELSD